MKILVTGAAGFIGSALIKRLTTHNHTIYGLIHNTTPLFQHKNVTYLQGDITNFHSLKKIIPNDIEVVYHCAALVKDFGKEQEFLAVNVTGTKNLVQLCNPDTLQRFIYISHTRKQKTQPSSSYSKTKWIAEQHLLDKHKTENFPTVIIRPGNVYGPGASVWVLKPLEAIKKNRITLINHGNGIFQHTYVDNLIDALLLATKQPEAIGQIFNITDGDNTTTWGTYLNQLAEFVGKDHISRNLSKTTALFIAKTMMILNRLIHIQPWVTPMAIQIFTNTEHISIEQAQQLIYYQPKISYPEGMQHVHEWLQKNNYIPTMKHPATEEKP